MDDQIGTVLHWSNQKEPEQAKSNHEVIRRNLDGIHISKPSKHSLESLIKKNPKLPHIKNLNNSGDQTMRMIKLKFKMCIPHQYQIINMKFLLNSLSGSKENII